MPPRTEPAAGRVYLVANLEGATVSLEEILKEAVNLEPQDPYTIVDEVLCSLDEPAAEVGAIWADEAEKRLHAYRGGELSGIPMEDVFGK